jgi:hypothetical protein
LDYEKIAGIFVMKSVSHVHKDKHAISERKAILTSKMVNGPAGEAEFLLGTLGLRPGDKICDTRTNLMYIFGEKGATESDMPPKIFSSLVNKALPDFKGIEIDLTIGQSKDGMMVVCFFDINQRSSRNCITQLTEQAEQLKEDITVIAIHASKVDKEKLDVWVKNNDIPFPIGMIQSNTKEIHFTWGVRSLPWLILMDRDHIVTAEGFGLDELDKKIRKAGDTK